MQTRAAVASAPPTLSPKRSREPRALVVTWGSVLDPRGGWAVRARSIVDAFAGLGVRTSVISHSEPRAAIPSAIDTLHVLRRPLRLGWSTELARAARLRAPDADVIVVESALLLPAVLVGRPSAPIVWDTTECETLHYSRLEPTLETRLRKFAWVQIERWAVRRADVVVAISEAERESWLRLFPAVRDKLTVVHHTSSARPMTHREARPRLERLCGATPLEGPVLLFVGNQVGKHNVAAARWIVDELAPRLPSTWSVVLAGPGTESLATARRTGAAVVALGSVDDIDAVIAGADVCLAPLASGAGVKTKVLDYVAHGRPVVATPVAVEGIEDAPGVRTVELDQFASAVQELVQADHVGAHDSERERAQREWIEARHGSAVVAREWQQVLERVGVRVG